MAGRKGRAWGNALGGYKTQSRRSDGKFGSGSGRSKVKKATKRATSSGPSRSKSKSSKSKSVSRKSSSRPKTTRKSRSTAKQNKRIAATKPLTQITPYSSRKTVKAQKKNIKAYRKVKTRGKTTKSIQSAHRRGKTRAVIYSQIGARGGQALALYGASKAGYGFGGTAIAGQYGALLGGTIAGSRAQTVNKRKGQNFDIKRLNGLGVHDRAAIVKREKRVQRGIAAAGVIESGYKSHRTFKQAGGYGATAAFVRDRRAPRHAGKAAAASRGIPQKGATIKGGTRINGSYAMHAKARRKRGGGKVYRVTTL